MYLPKSFAETDPKVLYQFMRDHNFATLVTWHVGTLSATHLPLMVDEVNGLLKGHLARANDQWKHFEGQESLVIFQGPHAYISPSWYETHPSVPTWNYTAIHVYGTPRLITESQAMYDNLAALVKNHEQGRTPEWNMDLPEDYMTTMMRSIVVFEIPVTRIEGKFKLSQNRSDVDQESVITHLHFAGSADEIDTAALMASRRPRQNDLL